MGLPLLVADFRLCSSCFVLAVHQAVAQWHQIAVDVTLLLELLKYCF